MNETSDLTPKERQALKSAVEIERGRKACEAEEIAEVKAMSKRKIFDDMMEGAAAMKSHREDEITLRADFRSCVRNPSESPSPPTIRSN